MVRMKWFVDCVGGNSNDPHGFISLNENLMMIAMRLWMLLK